MSCAQMSQSQPRAVFPFFAAWLQRGKPWSKLVEQTESVWSRCAESAGTVHRHDINNTSDSAKYTHWLGQYWAIINTDPTQTSILCQAVHSIVQQVCMSKLTTFINPYVSLYRLYARIERINHTRRFPRINRAAQLRPSWIYRAGC